MSDWFPLCQKGGHLDWISSTVFEAARFGYFHIIEYAYQNGCDVDFSFVLRDAD